MKKVKFSQNSVSANRLSRTQLNEIVGGKFSKLPVNITCPDGSASITNCIGVVEYHDNWFSNDTITCSGQNNVLTKTCNH